MLRCGRGKEQLYIWEAAKGSEELILACKYLLAINCNIIIPIIIVADILAVVVLCSLHYYYVYGIGSVGGFYRD